MAIFRCVPTPFLLVLHPCSKCTVIKNSKSHWNALRSLRLLLSSTQNVCSSMTRNCSNRTWLEETGLLIFAGNQPKTPRLYLKNHIACVFLKLHICFFLSVLKTTKHTAHMLGGIKTLKPQCDPHFTTAVKILRTQSTSSKTRAGAMLLGLPPSLDVGAPDIPYIAFKT